MWESHALVTDWHQQQSRLFALRMRSSRYVCQDTGRLSNKRRGKTQPGARIAGSDIAVRRSWFGSTRTESPDVMGRVLTAD